MSVDSDIAANWTAKPGCPQHLIPAIERRVASFPTAWRAPPANGEVFENTDQCLQRLQAWAFIDGFVVVVRGNAGGKNNPGKIYQRGSAGGSAGGAWLP